jgi:hypothetical protein
MCRAAGRTEVGAVEQLQKSHSPHHAEVQRCQMDRRAAPSPPAWTPSPSRSRREPMAEEGALGCPSSSDAVEKARRPNEHPELFFAWLAAALALCGAVVLIAIFYLEPGHWTKWAALQQGGAPDSVRLVESA